MLPVRVGYNLGDSMLLQRFVADRVADPMFRAGLSVRVLQLLSEAREPLAEATLTTDYIRVEVKRVSADEVKIVTSLITYVMVNYWTDWRAHPVLFNYFAKAAVKRGDQYLAGRTAEDLCELFQRWIDEGSFVSGTVGSHQ